MTRIPFRRSDVACRIYHPGGSMTTASVATRNLSAGGTSFLYHGFLHKNTKIELVLARRQGSEDVIAGTVTHCQHLVRTYHQIGMKFATKVFPKLYLDPNDMARCREKIELAELKKKAGPATTVAENEKSLGNAPKKDKDEELKQAAAEAPPGAAPTRVE